MIQLPRYQCHKQVWALKIKSVTGSGQDFTLEFDDGRYAPISVTLAWWGKHRPEAGGYYVVYPDGYKSYSPSDAFEGGYTLIAKQVEGVDALLATRIPILEQITELCWAIEKCGASLELTDAVTKASALRKPISDLVQQAIALGLDTGRMSVSTSEASTAHRRPDPAKGAPKPAGHNPVA